MTVLAKVGFGVKRTNSNFQVRILFGYQDTGILFLFSLFNSESLYTTVQYVPAGWANGRHCHVSDSHLFKDRVPVLGLSFENLYSLNRFIYACRAPHHRLSVGLTQVITSKKIKIHFPPI